LLPFANGRHWIVNKKMLYRIGISKDTITVPRGFVTDLASIPPILQSIIQQNGPYLLPAIVHDYLYWIQTCTRAQSDKLLRLAMIENKVKVVHRVAIYDSVKAAGSFAWDANARERAKHRPRIIPESRLDIQANVVWPEYQEQLIREGVAENILSTYPVDKRVCARADMPVKAALETR
jgi:hypothetical protein